LIDSDWNWNPSDDRDISAEWITLERSLTFARLRFDAFDELIQKRIKVIMVDVNDNVWEKILDVEVYAPIPDVTYGEQSQVRWLLRENISLEPITLFRYRWWVLSKLRDTWGADRILTGFNGEFQFNFPVEDEWDDQDGWWDSWGWDNGWWGDWGWGWDWSDSGNGSWW